MIVTRTQAHQVIAGRKTQARVTVKAEREVTRPNNTTYTSVPFVPQVGGTFTVTLRDTPDTGREDLHIKIADVAVDPGTGKPAPQRLGDIDYHGVRAEGHKTTDDFKMWWVTHHDRAWYLKQAPDELSPGDVVARFDNRHADNSVWVVTLTIDHDARPRMLHKNSEIGYTTNPSLAMAGESEAVDRVTQEAISRAGRELDALRAMGAAEESLEDLRDIDRQIVKWRTFGLRSGVNVRDQVRMLQQVRSGLERKVREQATSRQQAA